MKKKKTNNFTDYINSCFYSIFNIRHFKIGFKFINDFLAKSNIYLT